MKKFVYKNLFRYEEFDWWNRALRKIVIFYIESFSKVKKGKLLDVGCGTGYFLTQFKLNWNIFGIDISREAIRLAKLRGLTNIKLASIEAIPFASNSFDVIIVLDVLEHVKNERKALEEVKRVLRPGGIAIFNSPAFQFLWSHHDSSAKHLRRYTMGKFEEKLLSVDFKIVKITYINFLLFPVAVIYRLITKIIFLEKEKTDVGSVPKTLQPFLYTIFSSEARLVKFLDLPFGLSISAVVTK